MGIWMNHEYDIINQPSGVFGCVWKLAIPDTAPPQKKKIQLLLLPISINGKLWKKNNWMCGWPAIFKDHPKHDYCWILLATAPMDSYGFWSWCLLIALWWSSLVLWKMTCLYFNVPKRKTMMVVANYWNTRWYLKQMASSQYLSFLKRIPSRVSRGTSPMEINIGNRIGSCWGKAIGPTELPSGYLT